MGDKRPTCAESHFSCGLKLLMQLSTSIKTHERAFGIKWADDRRRDGYGNKKFAQHTLTHTLILFYRIYIYIEEIDGSIAIDI